MAKQHRIWDRMSRLKLVDSGSFRPRVSPDIPSNSGMASAKSDRVWREHSNGEHDGAGENVWSTNDGHEIRRRQNSKLSCVGFSDSPPDSPASGDWIID